MKLNENELKQIEAGASWKIALCIGAAVTFLIGLFDGYIRPLKCN